jgi:hypothetical protein
VPPIRGTDGGWARGSLGRASAFSRHLEGGFNPYPGLDMLPILNSNDCLDRIPLAAP